VQNWTDEAYAAGRELWGQIHDHGFIRDLRENRLTDRQLAFYFEQNTHYIDSIVRSRAVAGAKAPDVETRDFCMERGPSGKNELQHQIDLLRTLGGDPAAEPAPACHGYTRHLMTIAYSRETVDFLAAFLPCPWSYDEIGSSVEGTLSNPVTSDWMQFYWSEDHHVLVRRHRAIVDRLAADLSAARRRQLLDDYLISLRYEYRFWDMAYRCQRWPSDKCAAPSSGGQ
jgi:thiaminase/transcriptional activator TenA